MTYIDYLNQFNLWLESNALPSSSQLMYYKLLHVFNRAGWPETVQVDNRRMMLMTDSQAETTVIRARNRLVDAGFITYEKGRKGAPNRYALALIHFNNESESASESASISASISASTTASHIKTKNKTKTKTEEGQSASCEAPAPGGPEPARMDYEAYRAVFLEECPSLSKPGPASGWSDTRKKTLRARHVSLDGFRQVCRRVEASDFLTGRVNDWHGCSLDWIIKAANWQKINEGNYDNREKQGAAPPDPCSYDLGDIEEMASFSLPEDL